MADPATLIRNARVQAGLSQTDLAARAGTSQPALARYETRASQPSIATLERLLGACGRRLELRTRPARADSPVRATSLRGQLGPHAQRLRAHRRALLDSARKHGIRRVHVFGSLARGEDKQDSDLDLLVELAPDRTLLDLEAFRRETQELLSMQVDVATPDMLKQWIRDEVLAEALPL